MIGVFTLYTSLKRQPVDSQVEAKLSESYLVNTDCIVDVVDAASARQVRYKFNPYDDRIPQLWLEVTNSASAIATLADATPASTKVTLGVFENIQTFDKVSSDTAVTWNFNVADLIWGEDDESGAYSRIWVRTGGNKVSPYVVDHNISQIVDLVDTGTTTTTTSTTSTSSTSTSTTSTTTTTAAATTTTLA